MHGRTRAAAVAAGLLLAASPAGAATLKADYRFDNDLTSAVAGAPALQFIPSGSPTYVADTVGGVSQQVMVWTADQGLTMSTAGLVSRTAFTVVVRFRMEEAESCYRRILGFRDEANLNDSGLYVCNKRVSIYHSGSTEGPAEVLANDVYVEVALTRSADGTLTSYVNGAFHAMRTDTPTTQYELTEDTLRLFRDDGSEESNGRIARLRVYDGALTAAMVADVAAGNTGDDTDGDGVLDTTDNCDTQAAATSDGCPAAPQQTTTPPTTETPVVTPPETIQVTAPQPAGVVGAQGRSALRANRRGVLTYATGFAATCAAGAACAVKAKLGSLGSAAFGLAGGAKKAVAVALTAKGAKKLRKAGSLTVKLKIVLERAGAVAVIAKRDVKLKAPG